MRRWFVILLLCLLPLQFSWAAVAAYCGHEGNKPAQHLGHHEHQHAGDDAASSAHAGSSKTTDSGSPAGFDFDCGHCHGSCASVAMPAEPMVPSAGAAPWVASLQDALRTRAQSPPERPQWRVLA